jgi:hypothetical protein
MLHEHTVAHQVGEHHRHHLARLGARDRQEEPFRRRRGIVPLRPGPRHRTDIAASGDRRTPSKSAPHSDWRARRWRNSGPGRSHAHLRTENCHVNTVRQALRQGNKGCRADGLDVARLTRKGTAREAEVLCWGPGQRRDRQRKRDAHRTQLRRGDRSAAEVRKPAAHD